jgi:hypothetical protein
MSFCSQKRAVNESVLHGTGPIWIAVLWRASFRLATEIPVQVHRTFRANEHRGTNLGRPNRAVLKQGQLKQGQLKARPTIQATAYFTIAYLVQTQ